MRHNVFIIVLTLFLLALDGLVFSVAASPVITSSEFSTNNTQTAAQSKQSYIPPGFEHITNDYQGEAQLAVGMETAGEANIDFVDRKDRITLSAKAVSLIEKAVEDKLTTEGKKRLPLALKKPMKANAEIAAPYLARSPHKITAYFNINKLKLTIYIPPKYYLSKQLNYEFSRAHPNPSMDYPANSLYYNVYRDFANHNQQEKLMWQVNGALASGKGSVHYQANSSLDDYFNTLYGEYYGKNYQYRLGYQQPFFSTQLAPTGNYWGFSMQQNPRLINSRFYSSYKMPFTLVLDRPYFVQILQRGNILFSGNLPQGESVLKTNRFPMGTYPITIKKKDLISGEEIEDTQIYSSQASMYNWLYSGFAIVAGIRSQALKPDGGHFNAKDGNFSIKNGFNVLKGDLDFSYTYANEHYYFGTQYDYLTENNFDYTLSAATDEKGNLLGGANASYRVGQSNLGANMSHRYTTDSNGNNSLTDNYSLSYRYLGKTWGVNVTALYNNSSNQLGGGINKSFRWGVVPLRFAFSLSHSNTNHLQALISLNTAFNTNNWTNSMQTLYDIDDARVGFSLTNGWRSREAESGVSNHLSIPIGSGEITQDSLTANYNTRYTNLYSNVSASHDKHFQLTQAQFGLQGAYQQSFHGVRLTNKRAQSGFIVDLPAVVDDDSAAYQLNNEEYKPGQRVFISRGAFQKSNLVIGSPSMSYQVEPDYYNAFLYPYNIHHIQLKLQRVCNVMFTLKSSDDSYWLLDDIPDVFVMSGEETFVQIPTGAALIFNQLVDESEQSEGALCNTGAIVRCDNNDEVDLGVLKCRGGIKVPQ